MKKNVDTSLGIFLQIINSLLEKQIQIEKQKQIPLKQLTKKEIKAKIKPWTTTVFWHQFETKTKYVTNFSKQSTKNEKIYDTNSSEIIETLFQIWQKRVNETFIKNIFKKIKIT